MISASTGRAVAPTGSNPSTPPSSVPPSSPPAGGSCSASIQAGTVWGDRYNTTVNVSGSSNWTVTVVITSPQKVSSTWSGAFSWSGDGNTMTVKANGSGNSFGFTTMMNGNSSARPRITACTALTVLPSREPEPRDRRGHEGVRAGPGRFSGCHG